MNPTKTTPPRARPFQLRHRHGWFAWCKASQRLSARPDFRPSRTQDRRVGHSAVSAKNSQKNGLIETETRVVQEELILARVTLVICHLEANESLCVCDCNASKSSRDRTAIRMSAILLRILMWHIKGLPTGACCQPALYIEIKPQ